MYSQSAYHHTSGQTVYDISDSDSDSEVSVVSHTVKRPKLHHSTNSLADSPHRSTPSHHSLLIDAHTKYHHTVVYVIGHQIGSVQAKILNKHVNTHGGTVINDIQQYINMSHTAEQQLIIVVADHTLHTINDIVSYINKQSSGRYHTAIADVVAHSVCVRSQWLFDSVKQTVLPSFTPYMMNDTNSDARSTDTSNTQITDNKHDIKPMVSDTGIDNSMDESCMSSNEIVEHNKRIADALSRLADLYTLPGEQLRKHIFQRASNLIRGITTEPIMCGAQARKYKGIGGSTSDEIDLIINNQQSIRATKLHDDMKSTSLRELQTVHGIGGTTAEKLYNIGMRTVNDLQINEEWLPLTREQRVYLQYYHELQQRIPRSEVYDIYTYVRNVVNKIDPQIQITICGSYRRGNHDTGDIDLVCTHPNPSQFDYENNITFKSTNSPLASFTMPDNSTRQSTQHNNIDTSNNMSFRRVLLEEIVHRLKESNPPLITDDLKSVHSVSSYKKKSAIIYHNVMSHSQHDAYLGICQLPSTSNTTYLHRRLDIIMYDSAAYPMAILGWTAQTEYNRSLRLLSDKKYALLLSDHSITPFKRINGGRLAVGASISVQCSSDIYNVLSLPYTLPSQTSAVPSYLMNYTPDEDPWWK